jgi:hypothetical protein
MRCKFSNTVNFPTSVCNEKITAEYNFTLGILKYFVREASSEESIT